MISEAEIAWAAGLFEGEGCIVISPGATGQLRVALHLASTDLDVVETFHRIVGAGGIHKKTKKVKSHHKQQYQWGLGTNAQCDRILRLLVPWFGLRRGARAREAIAVLEWTRTHCARGHAKPLDGKGCSRCWSGRTHCRRGHPIAGPDAKVSVGVHRGYVRRKCLRCEAITRSERRARKAS